jgi:hypothetical protein
MFWYHFLQLTVQNLKIVSIKSCLSFENRSADFCIVGSKLRMNDRQIADATAVHQGARTHFLTPKWLVDCIAKWQFVRPKEDEELYVHNLKMPMPNPSQYMSQDF